MKQQSLTVNAILNMVKQGCSILFPLITFPYVSRVLGSDGFGKYNFAFSVADYFIIFAALGVSSYAVREGAKTRDDRLATQKICCEVFTINVAATVLSVLLLIVAVICIKSLKGYNSIILIIAAQMIFTTAGADWINTMYEDYIYLTVRYVCIQVVALIIIFIFVKSPDDVVKYACIMTFAASAGSILNIWYIRRYVKLKLVFSRDVFVHLKPILILFFNALAISVYVNADITMLKFYQPDTVVGVYSLSSRIYNIAKRLVFALITVTTARLSYYSKNDTDMYRTTSKNTFNALIAVMLPSAVGLAMLSKPVVRLVGGAEYDSAWAPLCILCAAMIFALLSGFYGNCVLIVFGCDKALLISTSVSAVVNVVLNLFLLPVYGMYGAAVTTLIAEAVNFVIQYTYARKYVTWKIIDLGGLVKCVAGCVPIAGICLVFTNKLGSSVYVLLFAIPLSVLVYFVVNVVLKNETVVSLLKFRRLKK